jgi:hypothetical protein
MELPYKEVAVIRIILNKIGEWRPKAAHAPTLSRHQLWSPNLKTLHTIKFVKSLMKFVLVFSVFVFPGIACGWR